MTYVMPDVQGDINAFQSILKQIGLQKTDTLYILGDILDVHEHGFEILRQIMKMENVKCLLGNHELLCLNALVPHHEELPWTRNDTDQDLIAWFRAGGLVTLKAMQSAGEAAVEEALAYLRELPIQCYI